MCVEVKNRSSTDSDVEEGLGVRFEGRDVRTIEDGELENIEISGSHVMSGETWTRTRTGRAGVGRKLTTNGQDSPCFDRTRARAVEVEEKLKRGLGQRNGRERQKDLSSVLAAVREEEYDKGTSRGSKTMRYQSHRQAACRMR